MSIGHASGAGRNGAQLRPAGRSGSRSLHDVADPGANGGTLYGAFRSTCSREISIVAPASLPRRPIIACRRQPVPEARRAGEGRLGQRPISRGKHPSPVREQPLRGTLQGAMPFLHQVGWATPHAPLRVFAAGRGGLPSPVLPDLAAWRAQLFQGCVIGRFGPMSAGTPNQLRPVPPSHTGAELAPNLGPRWLGKSGFIGRLAGQVGRTPDEAPQALGYRSRCTGAPHCSLYAKPRILPALRRGSGTSSRSDTPL